MALVLKIDQKYRIKVAIDGGERTLLVDTSAPESELWFSGVGSGYTNKRVCFDGGSCAHITFKHGGKEDDDVGIDGVLAFSP